MQVVVDAGRSRSRAASRCRPGRRCSSRWRRWPSATLFKIGVGHHDHRAVGAQLHRDLLEPGRLADVFADVAAAGEADLAHARIAADAHRRLSPPEPVTQAIASGGSPASSRISTSVKADSGVSLAGLRIDRVAGGQRRADLVAHQVQRKVERRDRRHDAARHAQREAELAGAARRAVERQHFAADAAWPLRPRARSSREPARLRTRLRPGSCLPRC